MKTLHAIVSTSALLACLVAGTGYADILTVVNNSNCPLFVTTTNYNLAANSGGYASIGANAQSSIEVTLEPGSDDSHFYFMIYSAANKALIGYGNLTHSPYGSDQRGAGKWNYSPAESAVFSTSYNKSAPVMQSGVLHNANMTVTVSLASGQVCPKLKINK